MNKFAQVIAQESNATVTEKGMAAFKSSNDRNVDLFFKIGAMRGQNVVPAFQLAFDENADIATRIALWARDVREGAGERQLFRDITNYLETKAPSTLVKMLPLIPVLGRWDDLLIFNNPHVNGLVGSLISKALEDSNGLCAKWMPRKGPVAVGLTKFFGVSPKQWRKTLVSLTNVVEQKMCAKDWNHIEFGKLPSLASKRYSKAFLRNATDNYNTYLGLLSEGKEKVNAAAIYPHQIVERIETTQDVVLADAMWNALPNYLGDEAILPMIDTSGSMHQHIGNASTMVAHIAFALGMYLAEKSKGPFKDCFLTFSENSEFQKLTGSITSRYQQVNTAGWGGTTNIASAFNAVLEMALKNKVSVKDMPKIILILSDMQFDQCVNLGTKSTLETQYSWSVRPKVNPNALEMIKQKYQASGYPVPKIVFWNLCDRGNNIPVLFRQDGTALISGFSPAIMKSVLAAKNFTPEDIMMETVMSDRYKI